MIKRLKGSARFQKIKRFYLKYERHLNVGALFLGFIIDNITFQRIDDTFEDIMLLLYLLIAGTLIFLLNFYKEGRLERDFWHKAHTFIPLGIQFAFGGLFSAFVIFYGKAGTFSGSWPFLAILLLLLVGNEFFRKYYDRLSVQLSIFYLALFTLLIFFVPILLRRMGDIVFLLSGAISILLMVLVLGIFRRLVPGRFDENRRLVAFNIGILFVSINLLYFTDIIPPIPLSLKESEVVHSVERLDSGEYVLLREEENFLQKIWPGKTIHTAEGSPVYAWSSIFAPTDLNARIVHLWQNYDEGKGEWINSSRIEFTIRGGRDRGFRGFSLKRRLFPGKWRVRIETTRGQLLGMVRFDIAFVDMGPDLKREVR